VKLQSLAIGGFGRLAGLRLEFGEALTVVYGPNEAGKTTIAAAIVASLYGLQRGGREQWRPWAAEAHATVLHYELADGRRFEVQRDFGRDGRGVRVYDEDGQDVAAALAVGRTIAPGEVHLQQPLDAFVNASCVLQQAVGIDEQRSASVATALMRALDGGPREDAALGAIERLRAALRAHVGTARATVNHPLRAKREQLVQHEAALAEAQAARDAMAAVRERRAELVEERSRLRARRAAAERDLRALRAAELRARLDALHEYREELAARLAERARYDDVATFPADRVSELERALYAWQNTTSAWEAAAIAQAEARLAPSEATELDARRADVGRLDDTALGALREAARQAEEARARATQAANDAAAARREGSGGRSLGGITLVVGAVFALLAIVSAIGHWWGAAEATAPIAAAAGAIVTVRAREQRRRRKVADARQQVADEALARERIAADAVRAVLARFGTSSIEELVRRRERLAALERAAEAAERAASRTAEASAADERAVKAFDRLADELVPDVLAERPMRVKIATERGLRRRRRDGIENAIAMLAVRRGEILRGAEEFALVEERDRLAAAGIIPAEAYVAGRADELVALLAALDRNIHEADVAIAAHGKELELGEARAVDLAQLEETAVSVRDEIARLEAFERAALLAADTLERITHEAHRAFARRLETYAAGALARITAGRYNEIRVDPATLAIAVRVPESGAIEKLEVLSAGTRDQIALLVRFAMARMFAEGLETPPLLLDDPFAFWDDERIERCLPLIAQNAFGDPPMQTILFTASNELAAAAAQIGATRIDLVAAAAEPA
jgi:DNA repair exonuclease SbcCD ATPase subunit